VSNKTSTDLDITYAAAPPSGTDNLAYEITTSVSDGSGTTADTATKSGDGSTTTFTLAHSLGSTPDAATVQATSQAASTDFWVSNKTSTDLDITYAVAPPAGTDNLAYDITTS
jgi:hypothetical protein